MTQQPSRGEPIIIGSGHRTPTGPAASALMMRVNVRKENELKSLSFWGGFSYHGRRFYFALQVLTPFYASKKKVDKKVWMSRINNKWVWEFFTKLWFSHFLFGDGEKGGKKIIKPGVNKTMPGFVFLSRLKMRMGCAHNSLTDVNRMGTFVITRRLI